jgi:phage-related protein (TIGR01555 family)
MSIEKGPLGLLANALSKFDGWANALTGLGVFGRDRSLGTQFKADRWLQPGETADLYHHDDICQRIAEIYPSEAMREGVDVQGPDATRLAHVFEALNFAEHVEAGEAWGRALGGAIGVMTIDDGRPSTAPVDWDAPHKILCVDVHDRRYVQRSAFFEKTTDLLYAHASIFQVQPFYGNTFYVHRDRCLMFRGRRTMPIEQEALAGWDASVYQTILEVVRQFNNGYLNLDNMLSDASQTVVKLKGLLGLLSMKGGSDAMATRAALFDLTRGVARTVFLDAEHGEDMTKIATNFSGVAEAIDRLGSRLSAAVEIPVTKLLGISPAGMNATGESDMRNWYDKVKSYQTRRVAPHYKKALAIMGLLQANKIVFPKLYQPTEKEQAETRKTNAEADQIWMNEQVIMPEEVAEARFAGEPLPEIRANMALRRRVSPMPPGTPPALPSGT